MVRLSLPLATLAFFIASTSALPFIPRQSCATGFHIIVARGSNEAPGEGKPGQVATLIKNAVPGSDSVAVDYPAAICCADLYPESVADGITDTINKIHSYVAACPDARIVLVGFSQGGNVMTDALAGGVSKPDPLAEAYRKNIAGVVVFGDPSYSEGQSFDVGTSTRDGIFTRSDNGDSLALLNTYAAVLRSYCDEGDPFCASGVDEDVHSNEVPNHAQEAADFIVSLA
ncbi:putative acetylxylan esterase 2 precursor [Lophium mytilinum]|uniref:Putative acetylxylan esterase 2 n=1 Tax=Lophium mytilinum TaxID=390894 RepID=A0A6A6QX60_9PEZI|nr:putative acetylxylan esterase 2 precursor [Lophium mytilinum]